MFDKLRPSNGKGSPIRSLWLGVLGLSLTAISGFVAMTAMSVRAAAPPPMVQTDKTGYVAGGTVTVTGTGFASGEVVSLTVTHADGEHEPGVGHEPFTAAADADGRFVATWSVSENPWDTGSDDCDPTACRTKSGPAVAPAKFRRTAVVETDRKSVV